MKLLLPLHRHRDRRLRATWNYAQLGVLALPLSPFLGSLAIVIACGQTWRQHYSKIVRRPLNWGLAVLSIWLVITACFASYRSDAFLGLFNFLPHFLIFAGYSALIQTPAQLRYLAWIMVVTSVPVALIGLGQLFLGWAVHFQFLWIVLDWAIEPKGNPLGRMSSVFMYANTYASYLVMVFSLGLGLWIETNQTLARLIRRQKRLRQKEDKGTRGGDKGKEGHPQGVGHVLGSAYTDVAHDGRGLYLRPSPYPIPLSSPLCQVPLTIWWRWGFLSVAVIGNLVALILTDSRNAWAIAVLAALAFAIYQGWRWLVAVVAAVAGSVFCAAFGPSPLQQWLRAVVPAFFWARLTDQRYPDRPLVLLRKTQWQFAWSLTQQRPWTGWGLRNFTPLYQAQMHVWLGHPHNFLLMLTAETGIFGAVLLCGWVSWIVVQAVQLLRYWSKEFASSCSKRQMAQDRLIFFSYLVSFLGCLLFNTVDVTIFDARINLLGWLLLSGIGGMVYQRRALSGGKA